MHLTQRCFYWLFLLTVNFIAFNMTYKTVVIVHGLNCGAESFNDTKSKILEAHPGTNVILLKYYEDLNTLDPLPEQLTLVMVKLKQIMKENPDGIHLLCHSQGTHCLCFYKKYWMYYYNNEYSKILLMCFIGGLLCLGAVVNLDNHTIDTFISLSGPLAGQYGSKLHIYNKVKLIIL